MELWSLVEMVVLVLRFSRVLVMERLCKYNRGTKEGDISVSGSTVSFNGFTGLHESSGVAINIPKGTVLSTIDELDVYSKTNKHRQEEDNPKAGKVRADHAKVKVSDTVGGQFCVWCCW